MKKTWMLALMFLSFPAAAAVVGEPAPAFTNVMTHDGKKVSLADYRGKHVVLEWFNKDCPFVRKHYGAGNMQALQKQFTKKGVQWLAVISSAEGKQGFMKAADVQPHLTKVKAAPSSVLLDADGTVGRMYGAKTTPHMFIIGPDGTLLYNGAIDDRATADPTDIPEAKNFVKDGLDDALAGRKLVTSKTRPYGCSVKYK
jgi:peroxiredoxin